MTRKNGLLLFKILSRRTDPLPFAITAAAQYGMANFPVILVASNARKDAIRLRSIHLLNAARPWVLDIWLYARRMTPAPELLVIADLAHLGGRTIGRKLEELKLLARELSIPILVIARRTPAISAFKRLP